MTNNNIGLYNTDFTGISPLNLVVNETHILTRQKNLAVSPLHGAFYTETMVIKDRDTNEILEKNIDYRLLEPYSTLREITGKNIHGVVFIRDTNLHPNITLSYQCVGGEFAMTSGALVELLNSIPNNNPDFSWYDILLAGDDLEPENTEGNNGKLTFEWMCFCLEKIRNAILWSDTDQYQNTVNYINDILNDIHQQTKYRLDNFLDIAFNGFVLQINKAFLKLDKVENLPLATVIDGQNSASEEVRIINFERNKYIALDSVVAFKNALYDFFLTSDNTNIGKSRGVYIVPIKQSLFDMVNGAVGILASKAHNTANNIEFDENVYPIDATIHNSYSLFKVVNNKDNRGGIFICSDRDNGNMYIGVHTSGLLVHPFVWRKVTFNQHSDDLTNTMSDHLLNTENPHKSTKNSIGLNFVENLEPISQEEILCLEQCRKYVTYDAFLLFMKSFMVNEQAAAEDPRNENTTDKVQIIYSKAPPVNMSGCEADPVVVPPTPPVSPEPLVIDRENVSITNIQVGRTLDLTIAHVKGKIPLSVVEIATGLLPDGISIVVDVVNPVFGVYSVKLTGEAALAGIYSFTIRVKASVGSDFVLLPVEFNVVSVDQTALTFSSTQTTITSITTETLTIILSGGPINSAVRVKAISRYVPQSVGEVTPSQIEKIMLINTNSIGNGSVSFPGGNASGSIQRGDWENWATTMDLNPGVISPVFVRKFT